MDNHDFNKPKHDFREVLQHSPFHARLEEHCLIKNWMSWNGYQTPRVLDTLASEYFAIRSSCSVMDLTPMEKYLISGPDALAYLNRLVTRDISSLKPGRSPTWSGATTMARCWMTAQSFICAMDNTASAPSTTNWTGY